MTLAQEDAAI